MTITWHLGDLTKTTNSQYDQFGFTLLAWKRRFLRTGYLRLKGIGYLESDCDDKLVVSQDNGWLAYSFGHPRVLVYGKSFILSLPVMDILLPRYGAMCSIKIVMRMPRPTT